MMLLGLAALAATGASPPPQTGVRAAVQARATVRIVSGARLRFSEKPAANLPPLRDATIRSEGTARPAKLIEFE